MFAQEVDHMRLPLPHIKRRSGSAGHPSSGGDMSLTVSIR
jgi:hypothetical protein